MAQTIKRKIHFYELEFIFSLNFVPSDENQFRGLFERIVALSKTRAAIRYQDLSDDRSIYIRDVIFEPQNNCILGKLCCIRKKVLPEIMNTKTDVARDMELLDEEGLLETTHFVITYGLTRPKIAIEYNQFGAKIQDFTHYVQNIGVFEKILESVEPIVIIKDELEQIKDKIQRCSEFVVKVHKDKIHHIQDIEHGLYSALNAVKEHYEGDYVSLFINFNYRQRESTSSMKSAVVKIITKLLENRKRVEYFNTLKVKAENRDKNNRLEVFNLLVDKVESEIRVEKRKKYRTIVSNDIFNKIKNELTLKKFI